MDLHQSFPRMVAEMCLGLKLPSHKPVIGLQSFGTSTTLHLRISALAINAHGSSSVSVVCIRGFCSNFLDEFVTLPQGLSAT